MNNTRINNGEYTIGSTTSSVFSSYENSRCYSHQYGFGGYVQNMPEFTAEKADFPAKTAFSAKKQADSAENKCGGCRD